MQAAIDNLLKEAVAEGVAPNVTAAVAKDGKIIYSGAAGTASLGSGRAVTPDTPARIMSMSKMITSVGLLQLVEQGKVDLDAPLSSVLPEFSNLKLIESWDGDKAVTKAPSRQPTIREVMTHSSGFTYEFLDSDLKKYIDAEGLPSIFLQQRAGLLGQPLMFEPGSRWMYGTNIDIGGFIIEKVSGKTLGEYLTENIFKPLGMHATFFGAHPEDHEHHLPVHLRQPDEKGTLVPMPMPPAPNPDFEMGGGGLTASCADYLAFLNDLLSDSPKILKKSTVDAYISTNQLADHLSVQILAANYPFTDERGFIPSEKVGHSIACAVTMDEKPGMRPKGSWAWAGLLNSYFWADPKNKVAGIVCTQILPFADRKVVPLFEEFEKIVYKNL